MNKLFAVSVFLFLSIVTLAQTKGFAIVKKKDKKQVDILFNDLEQ
jgi:hypothetical protein